MPIRYFTDSPDAGDPACICSHCGKVIEAPDDDDGETAPPIRMWKDEGRFEARFHPACFTVALKEANLKQVADHSRAFKVDIFGQEVELSPMIVVPVDEPTNEK